MKSMYLTNKYTHWYHNIVAKAALRVNIDGYFEKHHIVPKALGGTDDESNMVNLTPKEHFICHRLLVKMTEGKAKKSMAFAIWQMSSRRNKVSKNRHKPTARVYAMLKQQLSFACKGVPLSEEHKQKMRGIPKSEEHKAKLGQYVRTDEHIKAIVQTRKSQIGKYKHSDETKQKIAESNRGKTGKPKTEEQKQHQSTMMTGRKQTSEHKAKRAQTRTGKPLSEETKQKIREARAKQVISEETKRKMSASHKARRLNTT